MPATGLPSASVAGRTGDAVTVSFSGHGAATADATSGGVGSGTATSGALVIAHPELPSAPTADQLAAGVRNLVKQLVTANGQSSSAADPLAEFRVAGSGKSPTISVRVAVNGDLASCASTTSCAAAVSIAVNGTADASISAPARCSGLVGAATAIAIAVKAAAKANASRGAGGTCAASGNPASSVSAVAGNTGTVYGVSLATTGAAIASARSGHLGAINTTATTQLSHPSAVAISGSTGDSAGIAIGADGASAAVTSGDSGHAAATCAPCSANGGVSQASSGDTGSSYALAGAGLQATVQTSTGDSGNADASVVGPPIAASSGSGGRVIGHSGDTGNAIAEAVDLSTWVTVTANSGDAGGVISIARGAKGTGSAVIIPSKPSHNTVHTGPPRTKPAAPPLIAAAQTSNTTNVSPNTAGSATVDTTSRASAHVSTHTSSTATSSSSTAVSADVDNANPIAANPAVVPAANNTMLGSRHSGNRPANIGLVVLPFLLLALVALAALIVPTWRRKHART